MISFYLLWTGCYFVLLGLLSQKWPKKNVRAKFSGEYPSVTVLIPFRNEMENLDILTAELLRLDYPELKILLIDDQSEDKSLAFLRNKFQSDSRIKILQSPGVGKKRALEAGVKAAESDLILCTDADCIFHQEWVKVMVAPFLDPKIQLVAGPIQSDKQTFFFQRFQQVEWASILLMTHYFFTQKKPLMCSGANLAYRKSAFLEVNGYDQNLSHLSGDDEFLLKKIANHFGAESCVYLPYPENLVLTKPQKNIAELLNQRIRWAGKWKIHRDVGHALTALFSFLAQLIWMGSLALLGMGRWGIVTFFIVWLLKISAERMALGKVLKYFKQKLSIRDFAITSVFHPIYVTFVAMGSLRGKFTWKGRSN